MESAMSVRIRCIGKGICKMRRKMSKLLVFVVVAAASVPAYAGWPEWKHNAHVDYARNNCWPQPFRGADAQSVVAPFEIMKANGWRDNNTLGTGLFADSNTLTNAGRLKVEWIVTQAPSNHRIVYVKSGRTPQQTAARVESVQLAVSELIPTGALPEILVTDMEPSTSSGSYQTLVHRALTKSTPLPRLGKFNGLNAPSQQQAAPVDNGK